ncbi:hypothetical protein VCUG_00424 [Vavraia culicis subsp. floridensis]|uniref:DNA topoisomerase n=1 Tax=Vavraia culicis (isolate floridensis) TaxID=948595 RepID=L2GWY2_VAVCU|nr:uncharacterized protein VCUG_00424 [Vavraia culicis subsp. floridensis]ELA48186.1 hypothetical protein VCUG_00424 [Vavraia culicis subsp. floridensis]
MKILNIAEKPSVAKSITRTIVNTSSTGHTKYKYTPVHKFVYNSDAHVFTSVLGHLYTQEFTENRKWTECDPIALFTTNITEYIKDEFRALKENLQHLSASADKVVIWTDCDREGEYIALEIQKLLGRQCWRARFSAITRDEIIRAMESYREIDTKQCDSVAARMELDLRIGASFTRLQTLNLAADKNVISYGSCQIPTLGFVVERALERKDFVAEKFFTLKISIVKDRMVNIFSWVRGNIFDKNCVLYFFRYLTDETSKAVVTNVNKGNVTRFRPLPLRTVDMQRVLSKSMPSHKVMQVAEALYQRGIISYPRTETDSFPANFDYNKVKTEILKGNRYNVQNTTFKGPRNGRNNDFAHLPIYPLKHPSNLAVDEKMVYNFIADRFIASISDDALLEEHVVHLSMKDENFTLKGTKIVKHGFLKFYHHDRVSEKNIGVFREGERFEISRMDSIYPLGEDSRTKPDNEHDNTSGNADMVDRLQNMSKCEPQFKQNSIFVNEGLTKPPNYLTESELIALMDKNGIGTDATIHEHIKKILDRKYTFKKAKYFIPTNLGHGLICCYKTLDLNLDKPDYRRELEKSLKDIELGNIDKESVINRELVCYRKFYLILQNNLDVMKDIFRTSSGDDDDFDGGSTPKDGVTDAYIKDNRKGTKSKLQDVKKDYKYKTGDMEEQSHNVKLDQEEFSDYGTKLRGSSKRNNASVRKVPTAKEENTIKSRSVLQSIVNDMTSIKKSRIEKMNNRAGTYLTDEENVFCDCREKAKTDLVKKGKNKDKEFYSCAKFPDGCNFFQWKGLMKLKDEFGPNDVKCFCGAGVRKFISNTEKNRGKVFFKCNKRYRPCKFFMWEDEMTN